MTPEEQREIAELYYADFAKSLGISVDQLKREIALAKEREKMFEGMTRAEVILRTHMPDMTSIEKCVAQALEGKDMLFRSKYEDLVDALKMAGAADCPRLTR